MKLPVIYDDLEPKDKRAVRLEYIRLQGGACQHCKEPLDGPPAERVQAKLVHPKLFPENFFNWPVHLHHNRKTGMTIGAVHGYCNAVLWEHHGE